MSEWNKTLTPEFAIQKLDGELSRRTDRVHGAEDLLGLGPVDDAGQTAREDRAGG